ncbi:MAG: right-handed parallel beta-helix repeat-containing protein [Chloroflexi bacterium]|nr:right-handed parallel beta-helix repeat-containing protein [Chloroflexota bacterium]
MASIRMRWAFLALLLFPLWAGAATYYVRPACANNGNGTTEECAASGGGTGAYNVMSSIASTADGQVELARGNTVYLIGSQTAAWNPGGVGTGDGASDFILRGDHPAGAGGFDGQGSVSILTNIGGASRNNITFRNLYLRNATGNCAVIGNAVNTSTDIEFIGITIDNCGTSGLQLTGPLASPVIQGITCSRIGDADDEAVSCVNATPAAGVSITGLIVDDINCAGNAKGRYCVNLYPPTTGGATGTIPSAYIGDVECSGEFYLSCINVQNDVDGTEITEIMTTASFAAPVGIHIGGQGTIGACPVTTDGTYTHDVYLRGGRQNDVQTADASGFYPDECSTNWIGERIRATDNDIAGVYLNDTAGGVLRSSISWANGDNALHVHGVSDNNSFFNNTFVNLNPYGTGTDQGSDVVQLDGGAGTTTPNVLRNNVIVGNANKCMDVDGSSAYVTESRNLIQGCATLVEGFTQTSGLTIDPLFLGGPNPTTVEGFRLSAGSPGAGGGTDLGDEIADYFGDYMYNGKWDIGAFRRDSCYRRSRDGNLDMARTRAQVASRCLGIPGRYPEGL